MISLRNYLESWLRKEIKKSLAKEKLTKKEEKWQDFLIDVYFRFLKKI